MYSDDRGESHSFADTCMTCPALLRSGGKGVKTRSEHCQRFYSSLCGLATELPVMPGCTSMLKVGSLQAEHSTWLRPVQPVTASTPFCLQLTEAIS